MSDNNIENLKPPFSPYDFFGYLIPSLTFFWCVYCFELGVDQTSFAQTNLLVTQMPLHWLLTQVQPLADGSSLRYAAFLLIALALVYSFGHVIASISSHFLDRLLIYKGHGYPYEYLVLKNQKLNLSQKVSRRFYKGMFFWSNALLLLIYWGKTVNADYHKWELALWILLCLPILKIIGGALHHQYKKESNPTQIELNLGVEDQNLEVVEKWLESIRHSVKTKMMLAAEALEGRNIKAIIRYCSGLFAGPYDICSDFIQSGIKAKEDIGTEVAMKYREAFYTQFKIMPEAAKSNNYWFCYFYVTENSPKISKALSNWFHLYSFARNMSTAFYLAYIFCVSFVILTFPTVSGVDRSWILGVPVLLLVSSVGMFVRFYYLYVSYYSKVLYRAFVFLQQTKSAKQ